MPSLLSPIVVEAFAFGSACHVSPQNVPQLVHSCQIASFQMLSSSNALIDVIKGASLLKTLLTFGTFLVVFATPASERLPDISKIFIALITMGHINSSNPCVLPIGKTCQQHKKDKY